LTPAWLDNDVSDIADAFPGESQQTSADDDSAAHSGAKHHSKQIRYAATHSESVFRHRRRVRVDLEMAIELEPLLERSSERKVAEAAKICVGDHHRVLTIEKSGDGDSDGDDLIALVGNGVEHWS
jgi:hypothetical protein